MASKSCAFKGGPLRPAVPMITTRGMMMVKTILAHHQHFILSLVVFYCCKKFFTLFGNWFPYLFTPGMRIDGER
jgi:hypothetical protein